MLAIPTLHTYRIHSGLMYLVLSLRKGRSYSQATRQLEEDNDTSLTTSYKKKVAHSYEGIDIISQAKPEVRSSNLKDTSMEDDDGDDSAMDIQVDGVVLHANIGKQLVCVVFLQKKNIDIS
jgi:hypothetical protein